MMERSANVRVVPGATSLDVILKNTHFPDDLLASHARVACRVQWDGSVPWLMFSFQQPAYDFSEPIEDFSHSEQGWLKQPVIVIRLILAETVIADRVSVRELLLSQSDSDAIKDRFGAAQ